MSDPLEQKRQQWLREAEAEVAARPAMSPLSDMSASQLAGAVNPNVTPTPAGPALAPPGASGPPDPMKAFAASAPAPAAAPPDPAAAYAASGPAYATETTKSKTEQGMSDADAKAQRGLIGEARGAQEKATASETEARRVAIDQDAQEQTRRLNEAAEEQKTMAAKQAVLDLQESEVKRKLQAGANWRPDRAELFSGSTGAARGILAAISVIAGGLMQGRGMTRDNQFLTAINEMIDENVADQVRQNSASIQHLREQKGDIQSAAAELKKRQLEFATQKLNARAALSKVPAAQAGLVAFNDASTAQIAQWNAEQEKALRKQVSTTISKHTAPVGPAAPKALSPQQAAAGTQVRALDRAINVLEQAEKSGDLAAVVGWQSKLGANSVQEFFGGLPPGQQKALTALRELEMLNRADWKSEPNGQAVQERLASIGIPTNDREIPVALERMRKMREDKLLDFKQQAPGAADPTVGAY
jgi:hypothetical protein